MKSAQTLSGISVHTGQTSHLNRIDVVGNDDQLSFLLLDERGDGVHAMPGHRGPLGGLISLAQDTSNQSIYQQVFIMLSGLKTACQKRLSHLIDHRSHIKGVSS